MHFTSRGNWLASAGLSVGVSVDPEAGTVTLLAPLYRRSLLLPDIASVCTHEDDGLNHGFVNWVVTGRAKSPPVASDSARVGRAESTSQPVREIDTRLLWTRSRKPGRSPTL